MAQYSGIDVSEYQGLIDWKKVRESGKQFAMLRCGYGRFASQRDTRFEENYKNAKAAGVPIGTYLFSYAVSVEQALQEADNCLELIRGKQFEYPIAYDVETSAQASLGREKLTQIVNAFCEKVEAAGYYVSIYASLNFIQNYFDMSVLDRYDLWLAQWASAPSITRNVGMWQCSATGRVSGISGNVDLDEAYKDYPTIIRENGLNGYRAGEAAPPETTPPETEPQIEKGARLTLINTALYSTSRTNVVSTRVNGTYYVYDGLDINSRYRVTNKRLYVGRFPAFLFVSGWVDKKAVLAALD